MFITQLKNTKWNDIIHNDTAPDFISKQQNHVTAST